MTVSEDLQISWLHCNICHRAFEGHNRIQQTGETIVLVHSDLYFYFTSCGHFFCENCLKENLKGFNGSNKLQCTCRICGEQCQAFKIHATIPEKVSMYLKPPINLLEDSLSIMMFQLNNANRLITALRAKISNQKDLLTRAKQEISQVKDLKQRIKILEEERRPFNPANSIQIDPNETLRIPHEFHPQTVKIMPQQPSRNNRNGNYNVPYSPFMNPERPHRGYTSALPQNPYIPPDSPLIHVPGRLSLKSPSISNTPNINSHNNNAHFYLNSPYPQQQIQMSSNRSKVPRKVIKRP